MIKLPKDNPHKYCKRRALRQLYTISARISNLKDMLDDNCPKLPKHNMTYSLTEIQAHVDNLRHVINLYEQ